MTGEEVDKAYNWVAEETKRINSVREATNLLDRSHADLRITKDWLKTHGVDNTELFDKMAACMDALTVQSDKYETWINQRQQKVTATMERLENR